MLAAPWISATCFRLGSKHFCSSCSGTRLNRRRGAFEELENHRLLSGLGGMGGLDGASLDIPDNLAGSPGADVIAPVMIDSAKGVRAAEIQIGL